LIVTSALACFHCGQPCVDPNAYQASLGGQTASFCCPGCLAVAETIFSQGLADYYKFRTETGSRVQALPESLQQQLRSFDAPDVLAEISQSQQGVHQLELSVSGMSCAACAWLIEKDLQQDSGVRSVQVNSTTARCSLKWDPVITPLSQLLARIAKLGYQATPYVPDQEESQYQAELNAFLRRLALSGIMTMQVMMLAFGLYFGDFSGIEAQYQIYLRWVSLLLTIPVMLYSAKPFFRSAWFSLRLRQLNMDVPISLALVYTFLASVYATLWQTGEVYFESVCMFVFLLQLGKFFEFRARKRARDATSNLLKIMPVAALLWDGVEAKETSARRLLKGQHILVRPGETIPADGIILQGQSTADESMLTGEYRAIDKGVGDPVLAGSVNHDGQLIVEVEQALDHSRLGQIIQLQQQTLHQKPALLAKTDRIARFFVQRLLVVAALTFVVWYFWIDPSRAFWVTLSVMVATCPCALSLATPTAITCALARLNRQGVLIRNQDILEILPQVTRIFFDKTGTLTEGGFRIRRFETKTSQYSEADLLNLIANLEQISEHPIAKAFRPYFLQPLVLTEHQLTVGGGLAAKWQGKQVRLGSAAFCGIPTDLDFQVFCCIDEVCVAAIQLADELRPDALSTIHQLKQRDIRLSILSGDASNHVQTTATELQLTEFHSGCTPEQKVARIQQAVAQGETVLMIGDGINDSPCFQAAHVSVALDSGSDLSKQTADVVLLHNQLHGLEQLLAGASQARRVIQQNLTWAFVYNLVIIPLAVCGFVSPYVAVIGMSASSILVVSNSLRLIKT